MGIDPQWYKDYLARNRKPDTSEGDQELRRFGVAQELPLHNEIIKFCNSQRPRWKYIHANPAARSTIAKGAPDFTLFAPGGKTLCIECKSKDGKLDEDQRDWKFEMEKTGHTIHVIRSMEEFRLLISREVPGAQQAPDHQ